MQQITELAIVKQDEMGMDEVIQTTAGKVVKWIRNFESQLVIEFTDETFIIFMARKGWSCDTGEIELQTSLDPLEDYTWNDAEIAITLGITTKEEIKEFKEAERLKRYQQQVQQEQETYKALKAKYEGKV